MARSTSVQLLKLKSYLNTCYNYFDSRSSLNRVSVRFLRRSRYSKELKQEELKYQRLLKTLKYGSETLEPETSSNETISTDLQKEEKINVENESEVEYPRINPEDITKKLQQKMTPLHDLAYKRQLQRKYKKSCGILRNLGHKLQTLNVRIAMGNDQLPCPVDIVIESPVVEAYRNKDDFSLGLGVDGNEKTVGYFIDAPTEHSTPFCISPKDLSVVKDDHKKIAEDFQNYINLSSLPASQHYTDKGYWKNFIVRSNVGGDVMGIVVMHPQELTQEELGIEKEKLKDYFSCIPKSRYNLHSLYFQTCTHTHCTHEQSPFELIMGEPFIIEEANKKQFHVSPDSFFPQNTQAAEAMLSSLVRLCRVKKSTTVVDICCGVGPVSLLFSPKVKKCIGIDDSMQAIIDAKLNAMENRSQNSEFIHGRPETVINEILSSDFHEDLLVVLNSSRCVINKLLLVSLRKFKKVDKIVYITNKPSAALDNFIRLCEPSKTLGQAFLPILAVPFDISPHTDQYGLIVMFQRL